MTHTAVGLLSPKPLEHRDVSEHVSLAELSLSLLAMVTVPRHGRGGWRQCWDRHSRGSGTDLSSSHCRRWDGGRHGGSATPTWAHRSSSSLFWHQPTPKGAARRAARDRQSFPSASGISSTYKGHSWEHGDQGSAPNWTPAHFWGLNVPKPAVSISREQLPLFPSLFPSCAPQPTLINPNSTLFFPLFKAASALRVVCLGTAVHSLQLQNTLCKHK